MLEHKRPLDKPSNVRRIDLTEFSILGPFVNSLFAKSQQHSLRSRDDMTFTDLWCLLVSMTEGWGKMSRSFAFVFQEIYLTYTIFVIKGSMAVAQEEKTELCVKKAVQIYKSTQKLIHDWLNAAKKIDESSSIVWWRCNDKTYLSTLLNLKKVFFFIWRDFCLSLNWCLRIIIWLLFHWSKVLADVCKNG